MNVSELIKYLQGVKQEAGDILVVVQPQQAFAHILECPEVEDRARHWAKIGGTTVLQRVKAVVIR